MATPSVLDPAFGAAGADRFRALLRRIVPLAIVFGVLQSGIGAAQTDGPTVAVGAITLGYGGWLLGLATRLSHWPLRRVVLSAWMPILPLAVVAAALQPLAVPALTILPLVAAAATLPFEPEAWRIRRLMAVCGLSSFGVILIGALEPIPTALPGWAHEPFVVATVSGAIGIFFYLLSQYSWRLREALADAVRANADLDAAHRERLRLDRRLHEARRAASLATLAGGVAHDFNNLLTAVVGNADLALADIGPDSPVRDNLEAIRDAGNRAAELGRLMLVYSAGARFTTDRLALPELVRDLRSDLLAALPPGVELVEVLDPATPEVLGSDGEIRAVVEHLVVNAGEAIGERAGVVTVRVGTLDVAASDLDAAVGAEDARPGRYVAVSVEDTGPGVDPSVRDRIFDPFVSTRFVGRGLGLAAVFGIVRGHHGVVLVDDAPGGGARFRVVLPPA
jgi:signal transduction histidine kinase